MDRASDYGSEGVGSTPARRASFGKWLSLAKRSVWDREIAGSNPVFPTIIKFIKSFIKWVRSSAGRAPALHAGGRRFDPDRIHHYIFKYLKLSWRGSSVGLEHSVHTRKVMGSNPFSATIFVWTLSLAWFKVPGS